MSVLCNNHNVTIANSVNSDSTENFSNLKSRLRDYITNLTKCANRVTIPTDDISNYDEVCLLCNKIQFAVFNVND